MNFDIYNLLLLSLGLFAAAAVLSVLSGNSAKRTGWIHFAVTGAAAAVLLYISWLVITEGAGDPRGFYAGDFALIFLIDGLSSVFLAIIAVAGIAASLYSIKYMEHYKEYSVVPYYVMFPVFIAGMALLVTVDDLSVGFTIAWQVMTVSSFYLIRYEHKKEENRRFAMRYLVIMEIAWAAIAGGALLATGSFTGETIHHVSDKIDILPQMTQYGIYALILAGFACKAAVFPLGQMWLPGAHSVAPAPVSALLSGVMLKTGIYGIVRTSFWMAGTGFDIVFWGWTLALFGTVTLFIGTVQSMKQNDGKRLLAYSSIGQLGYIVLALGAALIFYKTGAASGYLLTGAALIGAMFHMMNHAAFKGLLFLSSGSVLYSTGEKDLNKLGGLMALMPLTAATAAIASISIAGMPPFSGFASKWTIIVPMLGTASLFPVLAVCGIVALFTSVITLACYVKYFGMTFTSTGLEKRTDIKEVPAGMKIPVILMTVIILIQGLFPALSYGFIRAALASSDGAKLVSSTGLTADWSGISLGSPLAIATASPVIVAMVLAVFIVFGLILRGRTKAVSRSVEPWLCGYQLSNSGNRYRSQSMFTPLKNLFWWAGGNDNR